jgi:hypothetical protein
VSIYQIKSKAVADGASVGLRDALVTAKASSGVFLQVKEGDAGYMGAEHSGIFVNQPTPMPNVGDRVDVSSATVVLNYFGQVRLTGARLTVKSSGVAPPAPVTMSGGAALTTADLATGAKAAALEGVIVRVADVKVTDVMPAPGTADSAPTNEFVVTSNGAAAGVRVNDFLYLTPMPPLNDRFASITGVLQYRNDNYKIEPRSAADVVPGAPALIGLGPNAFARVSATAGATIPTAMEVRLSRAATAPTDVTLTSMDGAKLEVVSPVTIPMGATSAPIQVRGLAATTAPVTIVASLNGDTAQGGVRVLDGTETPVLTSITPATAKVVAGGTVQLTVHFDIPVAAATTVNLMSTVNGAVPATVVVDANTMSASFTYRQMGSAATDTVTASYNGVNVTATVSVGNAIVINEVDYDNSGTDTQEFVELYNASAAPVSLSGLALILINGANGMEYERVALTGTIPANGYYVVGYMGAQAFSTTSSAIQNGPDAVALFDVTNTKLVDAVTYGGTVPMATIGGAMYNLVRGTANAAVDTTTTSIGRCPNGVDTDNARNDWKRTTAPTPGAANACP